MEDNTQELPEAQATDSSVKEAPVAEKFANKEFNRPTEKSPIEKLADKISSQPERSAPDSELELPQTEDSSEDKNTPPSKEAFNFEKWDGKVESLPEKVQKIVKDNQAMATAKAQEAAQYKKQLEEMSVRKPESVSNAPLFTQDEYEEAQLNPNKFAELVERVSNKVVEQKSQELMPIVSKIQYEQTVASNEKAINDFAKEHTDFWELYEDGLLEPFVQQTKNLEQAYSMAKAIVEKREARANQKAQGRVKEKKAASTFGRSTSHTENVMFINGTKDDALRKQIELAMQGKNIQVKPKN